MKTSKWTMIGGLVVSLLAWSGGAFAAVIQVSPAQGTVEFDALGRPAMLKIHGVGTGAEGALAIEQGKVTGELSFDLNSLETGISLRNKHMKEKYLKTGEHPKAVLHLDPVAGLSAWNSSSDLRNVPFTGMLSLSGSTKSVSGTVSVTPASGKSLVEARFELKLTDFGIELPSFAGVTVADRVQVQVRMQDVVSPAGAN
jgi:polyisoprenoid-binding protein YceI